MEDQPGCISCRPRLKFVNREIKLVLLPIVGNQSLKIGSPFCSISRKPHGPSVSDNVGSVKIRSRRISLP